MYTIEGDNAELMVIIVEPDGLKYWGAGGAGNTLTIKAAERHLNEAQAAGKMAELLVVWPENADGDVQVEQRDIEDIKRELYDADDDEDEED